MKACTKCGETKSLDQFSFRQTRGKYESQCKACACLATKAWSEKNQERRTLYNRQNWRKWNKPSHSAELRQVRRLTPKGRAKEIIGNARTRAKRIDVACTIDEAFVENKLLLGRCDISDLPFDMGPNSTKGKRNPFAPSLDRVENNGDYTFANTRCVLSALNFAKNEHNELDFIAMCVAVAERHAADPSVQQRLRELRNAEF